MSRYRFLRTRRWVGLALVVVLAATACVLLGMWQWTRHESRASANELVNANYGAPAQEISELVDDAVPADLVWRSVEVEGSYVGEQVLVRNRPVDGNPAARVLAVLRAEDDDDGERLVVVDRGWLPLGEEETVPPVYPDGEVSVVGRLRQAEPVDSRTAPDGQVYAIEPATVARAAGVEGTDLFTGYVLATTENGAPVDGLHAFPRPETTPGSHLSYAFQWWVFAVGFLIGYVVLARREAADIAAEAAGEPTRPERTTRRRTDADEEDALIDAQLDG
ncbi:SURF1 family protein [Georgenia sp. H159]|uniref:SURF1 family cytochrome oxidase biogenesis protein n=1 Tax=Georgenia sp. H159 TaxID=3076115 RepID=UPI002D77EA9B|nr:SURF1 family protein [Georgenia sp. H159]